MNGRNRRISECVLPILNIEVHIVVGLGSCLCVDNLSIVVLVSPQVVWPEERVARLGHCVRHE